LIFISIEDFKTFSYEYDQFSKYHSSDFCRNVWLDKESVRIMLHKILSHLVESYGYSYVSAKSQLFNITPEV